jgi:hypothetical protein
MDIDEREEVGEAEEVPVKSALAGLAAYSETRLFPAPEEPAVAPEVDASDRPLVRFTDEEVERNDVPMDSAGENAADNDGDDNGQGAEDDSVNRPVTQQDIIDAVRTSVAGGIPRGGATLEEDDRPDDVPRGLKYGDAEIRHGVGLINQDYRSKAFLTYASLRFESSPSVICCPT